MRKAAVLLFMLAATCVGCSTLPRQSEGNQELVPSVGGPSRAGERARIKHVIVVIQENRSFENFFAGYPGADAPLSGCGTPQPGSALDTKEVSSATGCPSGDIRIKLHQVTFQKEPNLPHEFESALIDWRDGNMDGFTYWGRYGSHQNTAAYAYVQRSQVAPYWDIANQYVLADEMFPTEFGPSWTAHLTLVAGTDNLNDKDDLALADFADGRSNCNALAGTKTTTVDSKRVVRRVAGPYPCLDQFNTMAQVLDTAQVSWKYYHGGET